MRSALASFREGIKCREQEGREEKRREEKRREEEDEMEKEKDLLE